MSYRACIQHHAGENQHGIVYPQFAIGDTPKKEAAKGRPLLLFENLQDEDVLHPALCDVPPFSKVHRMI